MAFIRFLLSAAACLFAYVNIHAQTVYYPAGQSQLLRSTAEDMAMLLQRSVAGSNFTVQQYSTMPATGIVLIYDESVTANQTCRVTGNGSSFISFSAGQDNGICYGVYEYLYQLGFRFYQPGTIWETTPTLLSPYKNIDTVYSCRFKYKNWFISGGCTTWAMDNNSNYFWDNYYGESGHQLSLYQRRNNMVGGYRFAGHRDEIVTPAYLATLQNNPCYVAPFNGSRLATRQSVPDINNVAAMQLWASGIENQYTTFRNNIFAHADLYYNYVRNFNYSYGYIGLEVPDGSHWANSQNSDCGVFDYPTESNQHFTLANFSAEKINAVYPDKRFQVYAYDGHADVPSSKININPNIDVQVVPTAFQSETSAKGLLNRWYNKWNHVSEYHYLNIAQWCGETPSFYLADLKQTIQRLKETNSDGIVIEAAPSKFASLPFLLAANTALKNNAGMENQLQDFCNLFGGASATIYKLLQCWSNDKTVTVYNGLQDNKYKLPYYFQLVKQAETETQDAPLLVTQRLTELKAFMHYMVLYYDFIFDQRLAADKKDKAEKLCLYLAKINRLQVVNSSALINDIVNKYEPTGDMYALYNTVNGTAYQNGLLQLITSQEIETYFNEDAAFQTALINNYSFEDAEEIKGQFERNNMLPQDKINVQFGYTNGKDYAARSEFYLLAERAGTFSIKYTPHFDMPEKGQINMTVEDANSALGIIKDFTITKGNGQGILTINIPAAGKYKLTLVSKYKSSAAVTIITNGNYFYKNGPFLGSTHENYRSDLLSLPGWFYVPAGVDKVVFSINNSNPAGTGFASPAEISKAFELKDDNNNAVEPMLINTSDSALFYLQMPAGHIGLFWKAFKIEEVRLCFANISNIEWYAKKKNCPANDFKTVIKESSMGCITQLKSTANTNNVQWEIYDAQHWSYTQNKQQIDLPASISPGTIVILKTGTNCIVTKRLGDDEEYIKQKTACANGATPVSTDTKVIIYPNPGTGIYKCMQNGQPVIAEEISMMNVSGMLMANFTNTQQFNIFTLPAGMYFYTLLINKVAYKGKLVKM